MALRVNDEKTASQRYRTGYTPSDLANL